MRRAKEGLRAIPPLTARAGGALLRGGLSPPLPVLLFLGLSPAAVPPPPPRPPTPHPPPPHALLAHSDTTTSNIAAIAAFAASLGVTWKGVGGALAKAAAKLEEPLWGAALNIAIAEAITQLPGVAGGPPRGRTQEPDPIEQPDN